MSLSLGPLTLSWGAQNQPSNKSNVSAPVAIGLVATGALLGVAGTYVAPKVVPPLAKVITDAKDKTMATVQGLFGKKVEPVVTVQVQQLPQTKTWLRTIVGLGIF